MRQKRFNNVINFHSGLIGMSETSSDMRDLLDRKADDERAREAIAVFCYRVKRTIGCYAAALGGVDTFVFAEGIGERAPKIRARIGPGNPKSYVVARWARFAAAGLHGYPNDPILLAT